MNFYQKVQLVLLSGVLLASCSQEKKTYADATLISYDDFENVIDLKSEVVDLDSVLLAPIQLHVYDTILVVMNGNADKLAHVLNLNSKTKVAEHISVGQGPNEMLIPRFVETDGGFIQISDLQTSAVLKYDAHEFFKQEEPAVLERVLLKKRVLGEVRLLNKNYVGPTRSTSFLLSVFNEKGDVIDSIGSYPSVSWEPTDTEKINMYAFSLATNLKDRVAVCYNWTDLIDIYDSEGQLLNRIHGPKQFVSHFSKSSDKKTISNTPVEGVLRDAYFAPINVGNELWVLFSGKSETEENYSILANQIYVFGWDGTPKRILNLDQGIFSFTVDEKSRKIYGISDSPEFHIVAFPY